MRQDIELQNIRVDHNIETDPTNPEEGDYRDGLQIFTDASFDPACNLSGWAFVVTDGTQELASAYGQAMAKSNNSAEAFAFLQALKWCGFDGFTKVTIWTDSSYVVEACTNWIAVWRNNGWRKIDPNSKNRKRKIVDWELWQMIDKELSDRPFIQVAWCKGHVGNRYNEQADRLATMGRVTPR